jgi:hypothetical protein
MGPAAHHLRRLQLWLHQVLLLLLLLLLLEAPLHQTC